MNNNLYKLLPKILKPDTLPLRFLNTEETLTYLRNQIKYWLMINDFNADETIFRKYKIENEALKIKIMDFPDNKS